MNALDELLTHERWTLDEVGAVLTASGIVDFYNQAPERRGSAAVVMGKDGLFKLRAFITQWGRIEWRNNSAAADVVIELLRDCGVAEEVRRGWFKVNERILTEPRLAADFYPRESGGAVVYRARRTPRGRAVLQCREYRVARRKAGVDGVAALEQAALALRVRDDLTHIQIDQFSAALCGRDAALCGAFVEEGDAFANEPPAGGYCAECARYL